MSDTPAITVDDLAVHYRTTIEKTPTLKTRLRHLGRRQRYVREIEALENVSFEVPEGAVLGIIGSNGAGKSTLLRAVAGILPPSRGRITVRGQTHLLALGIGFNKQLSGRENVMLGGLAAGLPPAEVQERLPEIVAFADLGEFIDMPVNTYSSGMYGRLAFSVAVHVSPDILLIDEALSTGDAAFKERAGEKMQELCAKANTILLVSHGLGNVRDLATECLWLHKGQVRGHGDPAEVIEDYTRFAKVSKQQSAAALEEM